MKVAIYTRVSTEEQAKEGYSIEAQKQRLTDYVRSQAWDVYDMYVDDGYSAKNLDRPAVKRMIDDITAKRFDVVLVYRLDRLVRSVINLHELLILFDRYDVKFKSATEMFDTTSAMGRFFITLVGAMAQWERENLAERVKMGMAQKHAEGGRNGAVAPFGYDLVDGALIVNPIEAEIVKRIFALYRQNYGTRAIAKRFNAEGVPKRDTRYWSDSAVLYIITNPVYCGKIRWNYRKARGNRTYEEVITDSVHEAIITAEEYAEVERLREERRQDGKRSTSDFAFTGVLRCGRCGYAMHGGSRKNKDGRKRYYKCMGRFKYGVCDMPVIAEESVFDAYSVFITSDKTDQLAKMVNPDNSADIQQAGDLRAEYDKKLSDIQRKKDKWQYAFANDAISLDDLKRHTEHLKQDESYIRGELAKLPDGKKSRKSPDAIRLQLEYIRDAFLTPNAPAEVETLRKQFLNENYESIVINTDVTEAKGGPGRSVPVYITEWIPK